MVCSISRYPLLNPPDALNHVQRFGSGKTRGIDPGSAVKADRIDYQHIPVPAPDRIPEPGWVRVLRMRAPVHEYLSSEMRAAFIDDNDQPGCLENAERE
jgi:hypothetical protein